MAILSFKDDSVVKIKTVSLTMLISILFFCGCGHTIISPKCTFSNFTRNEELSKITVAVQVNEGRPDSERYFLRDVPFYTWEPNAKRYNPNATAVLTKPSFELLQESLSSSFSDYGYNVSDNSSVVMQFRVLRFLFTEDLEFIFGHSVFPCYEYAVIDVDLSIQKDGKSLSKRTFTKYESALKTRF
ncbi:MAG: hypothetical protein DRP56_04385 [Planctomycetota bacterium]|nr:MAG: hypothetical protein DRP56_04385 [Planctomycetota bacterium]